MGGSSIEIFAEIKGLEYTPFLCKSLDTYGLELLPEALSEKSSFILEMDKKSKIAMSWWVSPKRTRSYPYQRVYDTLGFVGNRITVIPVFKDEGKDGDRDFLQWDTVSLMSLLGVYVIISYYTEAEHSPRYENKITNQRFNVEHIEGELQRLLSYQSDALHWNLSQTDRIGEIAQRALDAYDNVSQGLNVEMHSKGAATRRIDEVSRGRKSFVGLSRKLAHEAQKRESITNQPKEKLAGEKGTITIKNYLGGYYYFTCDEVEVHGGEVHLIEGKHTKTSKLPSEGDIKDGLIKMALFSNLKNVLVDGREYTPVPVLKLTTGSGFKVEMLSKSKMKMLELLKREAAENGFRVKLNERSVV
ncbi:MAG: hypothetical protein ACXQT1_01520 [Methermicoccaceae archaeon]